MRRCVRVTLTVFTWLAIVPAAAYGQASITGVVRDTSGAVLPGVTVEAASPALIERVRSTVTDGTGQYRIENLRPGAYTVTFALPGFATVRREGIQLTGTFTATVNAELRVGALEETITVTGETPIVDVQNTTRQRVMDREILDAIPFGRSDRDLAVLIPGTTSDRVDVGGSATIVTGRALIHGSRGSSQRLLQSGLSIAVPNDGASASQQANLTAYQEVTVDTAAVDAEHETGGTRINLVPRDGGNTFTGTFLTTFANEAMQSDNYTQELRDRGLRTPNTIKKLFDINPGFGGPIKRDRLWFFAAVRYNGSSQYPAEIFYNLNANNPAAWTYAPDFSRRPFIESWWKDATARLTWQATRRNKVGLIWRYQSSCYCPEDIEATRAPEAALHRIFPDQNQPAVDWTFPATNRVLLEAGALRFRAPTLREVPPGTNPLVVQVTDQGLGNLTYRSRSGELRYRTINLTYFYRAAASYVTGAHAFKAGFAGGMSDYPQDFIALSQPLTFRFNNGVPNRITLFASPTTLYVKILQSGLYAQHRWTIDRLTLSSGVRYDHFTNWFPEVHLGPGPLVPTRNVTLPAISQGISWHDITPKSGAAYDLFGNGKTALKISLNKYLEGLGGSAGAFGVEMSPAARLVRSTTRSWNDANGNFVPDCDLTLPAADGECAAMANRNFGTVVPGATYDPEATTGWGKRDFNWEFSAGVQHEVFPRTSVDVSYFRRWFGNFAVTDNRAVAPTDFDPFSITAPAHPALPGGGGYVISGLYDLKPAKFGVPADNVITLARKYGKQIEHWNGADVTVSARPRPGVMLQGGLSTGRRTADNCDVVTKLDNPSPLYCRTQEKFLTQVKFLGSYTIPRVDVQVSGTFRSLPGPQILANYDAPNAVVAPSLGRNLAGGERNVTVSLVEPRTMYGERMNQVDLRVAKILQFGRTRTSATLDLYNMFNANPVLTQSNAFATWLRPESILLARFIKVGVQLDF